MSAASFGGKTVVITGASSGLGAALAEAFAAAGANLALFARSGADLEAVAARCTNAPQKPLVVVGDVTLPADCQALVTQAVDRFGGIDIVVASAGIGMWARFDKLRDPLPMARIMEVNYGGLVNVAFHALPHLKQSGGLLAAISSVQGKVGVPYHSGYAASKHAVQGFCDSLRMELQGSGVGILTVLPHWIQGTRLRERALAADGTPKGLGAPGQSSGAVPLEEMTRRILHAIKRRKRDVFVPWWLRVLAWLSEVSPAAADGLVARRVEREDKRAR